MTKCLWQIPHEYPTRYINTDGLNREEEAALREMIINLRLTTDNYIWTPTKCRGVPQYTRAVECAHKASGMQRYFGSPVEK